MISTDGIVLRTRMDGISIQGRSTQGVAVINLGSSDRVGSVATIEMAPENSAATAEGPASDTETKALPGLESATAPAKKSSKKKATAALGKADAAMRKADETNKKTGSNGRKSGPSSKSAK